MTSPGLLALLALILLATLGAGMMLGSALSRARIAALEATMSSLRQGGADHAASTERADRQLRESFAALSARALAQNNETFVHLAEARLAQATTAAAGDLGQRQQAIESMVAPLRQTLERVGEQLSSVEKAREGSYAMLIEQVGSMRSTSEQLRTETAQLVSALKAPQVRGRWGEMQLERTVEAAGMLEHVDFVTQATATGPDGSVRPDMVVRLTDGKNVVVDSKVAFSAYLEAMQAKDEATRDNRMKAHARHLRAHVDSLSAKSYWERFSPTPAFVICFIPADSFLDAALREDTTLQEHAFRNNVVLATPSTLVALLRTIAYSWRQEALASNAAEVHQLGRDLYLRLSTMGGHIDKLGRSLGSAVHAYNQSVSSLESRVLVTARRMVDLDVVDGSVPLRSGEQLTEVPRATQAPELGDQRVVALNRPKLASDTQQLPLRTSESGGA
jgi:DNA recombination protein RmuC